MTLTAFTDEVLSPTRTTRISNNPVRDWAEVLPGDELLVDVSAYTRREPDERWCVAWWPSPGSESVYPYKVAIPNAGVGQYKASEILGWRRPLSWHRILLHQIRAHAGVS